MKTPVRYRIDNYGRGLVDESTGQSVCQADGIEAYFGQKKSKIRLEVAKLDQQIDELWQQREVLRTRCRHLHAVAKYGANTGNYDPTQDCYWIDFHCHDCGRHWTEDQP